MRKEEKRCGNEHQLKFSGFATATAYDLSYKWHGIRNSELYLQSSDPSHVMSARRNWAWREKRERERKFRCQLLDREGGDWGAVDSFIILKKSSRRDLHL